MASRADVYVIKQALMPARWAARISTIKVGLTTSLIALFLFTSAPAAFADDVAYLVNVTVRPGYNFPSADAALEYGRSVCTRIADGMPYAQLVEEITRDFRSTDNYQGSYLISQSAQELCPQLIAQLRQSAEGYRG